MASRRKESRMRRWSNVELTQFATVLVNEKESFLFQLETKAVKKASNMQIFANIKKNFDEHLAFDVVGEKIKKEIGEKKFKDQPQIETTISKLRIKYKWMKNQRKKYNDRIKSSSGKLAPIQKPEWLLILDPVLAETHADLVRQGTIDDGDHVDSSADDSKSSHNEEESTLDSWYDDLPSFCALRSKRRDANLTDDEESGSDSSSPESTTMTNARPTNEGKSSKSTAEGDHDLEENAVSKNAKKSRMAGKVPEATSSVKVKSRKRKANGRSHEQALRDLSEGIQKMSETIDKRMALMIKEEKSRDEAFMKFHERQCELNRQHELRMMEMMMRFAQPSQVSYSMPSGESVPIQAYYVNPSQGTSGDNNSSEGRNANEGK